MANFRLEDYDTVEVRLKRFWIDHPTGAVITDMASVTPDHKSVIIRAQVWFDKADAMPTGVGLAQEHQGGNGPNSTSWIENCDTSAVGRALANCGYSGDKRASREEMAKVNRGPVTTPSSRFTASGQSGSRIADVPRLEAPKQEAPKQEAPKQEAPRQAATIDRDDAPSYGAHRYDSPRYDGG